MTAPTRRLGSMAPEAGRGFLITFGADIGVQALVAIQGLLVPRLLGPENIGLYALATAVVSVGLAFRELGVQQKLVQERSADLPRSYSVAFTLEILIATVLFLLIVVLAPIVARLYDRPELTPIVALLALTVYTSVFLKLPAALHLRDLRYGRQNVLVVARPLVSFAVTVPLAFLGAGIWSLVAGSLAAFVVAVAVVTWGVSLRPRLRLERSLLRSYLRFGWPLWVANLLSLSTTWGGSVIVSSAVGISALGFFSVSQSLGQRAFKLDAVLGEAIFPALCRAQDDLAGQRRAFVATNRITVLWAGPIGFGLFVFADDLVRLVLGEAWEPAVFLFQMQGLAVTTGSIGFSWDVFFRAQGRTRPTLVFGALSELWVFVVLLPATVVGGLTGAAWAVGSLGLVSVGLRQIFVRRLFPGINLVANAWRELLTTGAAAAAAWLLRDRLGPPTSFVEFGVLLTAFAVFTFAGIAVVDGRFLLDLLSMLRRAPGGVGRRRSRLSSDPNVSPLSAHDGAAVPSDDTAELSPVDGAGVPGPIASGTPALEELVAVPGRFPLYLTYDPIGGALWIPLRDSSQLARYTLATGTFEVWRFPAHPNVVTIDEGGTAWSPLTLAKSIGRVSPSGDVSRVRLPGSREPITCVVDADACWVVDGRQRCLWAVRPQATERIPLPAGMGRPVFLVEDPEGNRWVTDSARPAVAHLRSDAAPSLVAVPAGTRSASVNGSELWVGHTQHPAVTCIDTGSGRVVATVEIPGVPFGVTAVAGRVWAAIPHGDIVVAVEDGAVVARVPLPQGSLPHAVAVVDGTVFVACAGRDELAVVR